MFGALALAEAVAPGRRLPRVRGWRARGLLSFAVYFLLSSYLPLLWDGALSAHRLVDLTGWGTLAGALAAVLVYEAVVYFWHRAMHASPALWRSFHQLHHSAERVDMAGAFYFSPFDMIGWTAAGSFAMVFLLGLTPQAATVALLVATFLGMFQHANIRTPRWLGYLVQRPESHTVHHARGIHRSNYSDLPIFDILFGTFDNPAGFEHETGFHPGASARVWDMLCFRDVSVESSPTDGSASSSRLMVVRPAA
jgi:sterol desaturase/sphingolipid hydroxylase (fatty acid hydroxylase superfamily)